MESLQELLHFAKEPHKTIARDGGYPSIRSTPGADISTVELASHPAEFGNLAARHNLVEIAEA